ncbi:MAG: hypothetical protein NTV80_13890 [Verrucomicrobia bacterium]|nr:hypothetical protein [Verrucomicrobiota bacterium]
MLPLDGEFGEQASDLIVEQLGSQGVSVVDRSSLDAVLREQDFRRDSRFDQSSLAQYGKLLGVKKIMAGTTTAASGPLYSYRHVNITLKVIDVSTGRVTWIGRYGNSLWSSAISTQGDLQRGAKHIVKEFTRIHGTDF